MMMLLPACDNVTNDVPDTTPTSVNDALEKTANPAALTTTSMDLDESEQEELKDPPVDGAKQKKTAETAKQKKTAETAKQKKTADTVKETKTAEKAKETKKTKKEKVKVETVDALVKADPKEATPTTSGVCVGMVHKEDGTKVLAACLKNPDNTCPVNFMKDKCLVVA
jgi:flagellar motor protein MotB